MAVDEFARKRAELQRLYAESLAGIGAGQREAFMGFGFQGDVNQDNGAVSFQIDPNLQFGQAQNLMRQHGLGRRQLMETNTARGLGRTGLAAQQKNLLKFMQGGDLTNLNARFMNMLGQLNRQRQSVTGDYNRGMIDVDWESARARANTPVTTPTVEGDGSGEDTGARPTTPETYIDWGQPIMQPKRRTGTWGMQ
jgi:hypothetical protein